MLYTLMLSFTRFRLLLVLLLVLLLLVVVLVVVVVLVLMLMLLLLLLLLLRSFLSHYAITVFDTYIILSSSSLSPLLSSSWCDGHRCPTDVTRTPVDVRQLPH